MKTTFEEHPERRKFGMQMSLRTAVVAATPRPWLAMVPPLLLPSPGRAADEVIAAARQRACMVPRLPTRASPYAALSVGSGS
jgi:hypothetical protein